MKGAATDSPYSLLKKATESGITGERREASSHASTWSATVHLSEDIRRSICTGINREVIFAKQASLLRRWEVEG
jgi:hypothetical protein